MSDMCKGMEELTQEYYQNGMERGMIMLVQDGLLEIAVAAEKLGMEESEFKKLLQE